MTNHCDTTDDCNGEEICGNCNGSGEGMYDGSTCWSCKGSGVVMNLDTSDEAEADEWYAKQEEKYYDRY